MFSSKQTLNNEERIITALRSLYTRYGYTSFKMSKFEDYELYARNKDFLVSDNVITFTDVDGRLMALKPDVTLSIIKNRDNLASGVEKVYYSENVYRVSNSTHRFSEIMQTGLECIGNLDDYCIGEVLMLAAKSLYTISPNAVLDISHLGVLSALLDTLSINNETRLELLRCISEKNIHELTSLCRENKVDNEKAELLCYLVSTYGAPADVLGMLRAKLSSVIDVSLLDELESAISSVPGELQDILRIDFSVVNDLTYYNGIVFKGFILDIPNSILSGGRYDRLLKKFGYTKGAIGFAVYMGELERLNQNFNRYDVDILLLYSGNNPTAVRAAVETLSENGESVSAQREKPEKLRYRRLLRLEPNGEVTELEKNA